MYVYIYTQNTCLVCADICTCVDKQCLDMDIYIYICLCVCLCVNVCAPVSASAYVPVNVEVIVYDLVYGYV